MKVRCAQSTEVCENDDCRPSQLLVRRLSQILKSVWIVDDKPPRKTKHSKESGHGWPHSIVRLEGHCSDHPSIKGIAKDLKCDGEVFRRTSGVSSP